MPRTEHSRGPSRQRTDGTRPVGPPERQVPIMRQIHTPTGFPAFDTLADCRAYEATIRGRPSNPDFPELTQLVTTLVTWTQVEQHLLQVLQSSDSARAGFRYQRLRTDQSDRDCRHTYAKAYACGRERTQTSGDTQVTDRTTSTDTELTHCIVPPHASATASPPQVASDSRCPASEPVVSRASDLAASVSGAAAAVMAQVCRQLSWAPYAAIDAVSVHATLRYLFFHMRCGIYVRIHDNRLALFVPFANRDYRNLWSTQLSIQYASLADYWAARAAHLGPADAARQRLPDPASWWCHGAGICSDRDDQVWGDGDLPAMLDMLLEVCRTRSVPDVEFFLNRRNHPQLKRNLTDPCDVVHPQPDGPLQRERHARYAPICGLVGGPRFADVLVPLPEDWATATGKLFVGARGDHLQHAGTAHTAVPWAKRAATCVFRGSATGASTSVANNQRMYVAFLSLQWATDDRYNQNNPIDGVPFLDAGITSWNERDDRKRCGGPMCFTAPLTEQHSYGLQLVAPWPLNAQTATCRYVLYLAGHAASGRYSFLMASGSTIFKVEPPDTCAGSELWFFPLLRPWVDHVPVRADLGDLAERIAWAKQHDAECQAMAQRARALYEALLCRSALLDYWQVVLSGIAAQFADARPPLGGAVATLFASTANTAVLVATATAQAVDVTDDLHFVPSTTLLQRDTPTRRARRL